MSAAVVRLASVRRVLVGDQARQRLVGCWSIIGGEHDPLRAVWDERATLKDRRLLLAMAGASMTSAARWSSMAWCDLRPEVRANITGGLRRFRGWAEKVAP